MWLAAFITIGIYSFLYKENPVQKVGEYMVVGLGLAHSIVAGYQNIRTMAWIPMTQKGMWYMAIPMVLGVLLWSRWFKQWAYLSRASIGLMVGVGAAVGLRGSIDADLFGQLRSAIALPLTNASNWVVLIGMFGTVVQFMYIVTAPNPKTGRRAFLSEGLYFVATYIGQATIMIALGAAYAYTIMGRVSIVIGRVQFLFRDWIYLLPK
jgi:hypothetical protein